MSKGGEKIDPFTVTTEKEDLERFRKLDFFDQLDAAVNNASKPDMKNLYVSRDHVGHCASWAWPPIA